MSDFLKRKRSSLEREREVRPTIELDIILELITNIIRKDDNEKCICNTTIPEIDNKNTFFENEIVPNLEVNLNDNRVKLSEIITALKANGYPLTGSMISVYYKDVEEYIHIGGDPIDQNVYLEEQQFANKIVKIRAIAYLEEKLLADNNNKLTRQPSKKNKRTKERKIGYIIEKVNKWRKLYNGFNDELGKFTKYSLDEAAKIIDISKKSLDDYLLQLRLGRKFGFDFNANKNAKVGVLRSFVKRHRNAKNE